MKKRNSWTLGALALAAIVALGACSNEAATQGGNSAPANGTVNVYNWADYIGETTLADFTAATGIKVNYDLFDSNEMLQGKLTAGNTGYDVVVPGSMFAKKQIEAGFYQKWDKAQLPNLSHLDPAIVAKLKEVDPGNEYLIPWGWSFSTVAVNHSKLEPVLKKHGLTMPANTWELLFNPVYTSKVKECGITLLDSPSEVFPALMHFMGQNPYNTDTAVHQQAAEQLGKVRPDIRVFSEGATLIDAFAAGNFCVAHMWAGDANTAIGRHQEAKGTDRMEVTLPSTGGLMFIDTVALLKDAKNVTQAHQFMNFTMDPKNSVQITAASGYLQGNAGAQALLDESIRTNKTINLRPEDVQKLVPPAPISDATSESFSTLFTKVKGQ